MSELPPPIPVESTPASTLTEREHRWLTAALILGTVALAFVVTRFVAESFAYFGDVIMIFFLAWLLAFILSPLANLLFRLVPGLPKALAVVLVYTLLVVVVVGAIVAIAQQLYGSISNLVTNWPTQARLIELLHPWQDRLDSAGLGQVHLGDQISNALNALKDGASQLSGQLGNIAVASAGVMGNVLFIFFLSLYMALDKDRIMRFLFRVVPPAWSDEAKLLERSVSRSFGGFLRGQAILGLIYGAIAFITSLLLGLPYVPVISVTAGVLQAIPFFGPFFSWAPPVLVAVFFKPDVVLPVAILMGIGWFVVMNVVQPRLLAEAVGLHPVVVLGSVLVGMKVGGITGAIFGIPIAAVISAFFFYWLSQRRIDGGSVAVRAARRVEEREGRPIRVPRLPKPGEDEEFEETSSGPRPIVRRSIRTGGEAGPAADQ